MCECQQATFAGESTIHSGVSFANVGMESSSIAQGRLEYVEGPNLPDLGLLGGDVSVHVSEPDCFKGSCDIENALISSGQRKADVPGFLLSTRCRATQSRIRLMSIALAGTALTTVHVRSWIVRKNSICSRRSCRLSSEIT